MPPVDQELITQYVETNIPGFHFAKLANLKQLELPKILGRKNPYLFKAKGLTTPREVVKAVLDAFLSSQEETMFGNFLEGLAIFVAEHAYGARKFVSEQAQGARKSSTTGIDLELEKDGRKFFVDIKSGPNWGNSDQIKKMRDNFRTAARVYNQNRNALPVVCVNGCCYGKENPTTEHKGDYIKLCGQRFWEFISGNSDLYIKIVEPIGHNARERNQEFLEHYELIVDQFTEFFRKHYCDENNHVHWDKITKLVSEAPSEATPARPAKRAAYGRKAQRP